MISKLFKKIRDKTYLRLPGLLLMNNVNLSEEHKREVLKQVKIETEWYKNQPGYESFAHILSAKAKGALVSVTSTRNYAPILRYRNPRLAEVYPPFLSPAAKEILEEVSSRWRDEADKKGIDPEIKLSVTSLIRTIPYQNTIIKAGKLAAPDSVHTRGEAFDIHGSGYYAGEVPVNNFSHKQSDFEQVFKKLNAALTSPAFGDSSLYNPQVREILLFVLSQMQEEGRIHFVNEYPDTANEVFHICRNPSYQAE